MAATTTTTTGHLTASVGSTTTAFDPPAVTMPSAGAMPTAAMATLIPPSDHHDDDDDDDQDRCLKKKRCCGKTQEDIDRDGCCDEDCCNRTCCHGRITCSLEAGFAATFAFLSFGAMLYANNSCDYVKVTGHRDENITVGGIPQTSYVESMERGIFFGEPVHNVTCLSWLSIQRLDERNDFLELDPWWYASMGCAVAASAFGFAAIVQIFFVSCFPRQSQRYAARCAASMAILAAVLEGCTLLYLNSNAVKDVRWPYHDNIDFTTFTLYIAAWCAVASCGGWFITAFILFFLKNPPEPVDDDDRVVVAGSPRSSRRKSDRAVTEDQDEEAGDEHGHGEEEDIMAVTARQVETTEELDAQSLSEEFETDHTDAFEDARMGTSASQHHLSTSPRAQAQPPAVDDSFDYEPGYYRRPPADDDFCDG